MLRKEIERSLEQRFGTLIGGDDLRKALAFNTYAALRKAVEDPSIDLPVFRIERRRGYFAFASELARWLVNNRVNSRNSEQTDGGKLP